MALLTLLLVVASQSCGASDLCVTVIDDTGLPLPNAWVVATRLVSRNTVGSSAKSYSKTTDAKGKVCLAVPEGTYAVEAGLTGFLNVRYYPVRTIFPNVLEFRFRLPVGDLAEDLVVPEAILSGTLALHGVPIAGAKVCIWHKTDATLIVCGLTNVFGEYALSVPPGTYRVEVRTVHGKVYWSSVSAPRPGQHLNRLNVNSNGVSNPER